MGAKNHQPTNTVLTGVSAWLSQRLGMGIIAVQKANNHLEDAIIIGMDKKYVEDLAADLEGTSVEHLDRAAVALEESKGYIAQTQTGFERIFEAANKEGYKGNALASKVAELRLDELFASNFVTRSLNRPVWDNVVEMIRENNILGTLRWEQEKFAALPALTDDFTMTLQYCSSIAKREGGAAMVDAVENNRIPVRQYGFRLFSAWSDADLTFMYSALVMTELYYRANGLPSLAEFSPVASHARIA